MKNWWPSTIGGSTGACRAAPRPSANCSNAALSPRASTSRIKPPSRRISEFWSSRTASRPETAEKPARLRIPSPRRAAARSPQPLQNADVIGDRGAAHIEDAAEARVLDLHVAGAARKLHGGERVHGHAGGADRMTLGLEPA